MSQNKISVLDTALLEANIDSKKRNNYYNIFLNSEIFIPTYDIPKEEFKGPSGSGEMFRPITTESDGNKYLMLFDSKEKLSLWAKKDVGFVAFQGRSLFQIFQDSSLFWILNCGTSYVKPFSPEEIQNIRESLLKKSAEEIKIQKGTSMGIGEINDVPAGIRDALSEIGKLKKDIFEIYLGSVIFESEDSPHFAVVIKIVNDGFVNIDEIRDSVGSSVGCFLAKKDYINIFFDEGKEDDIATAIKKKAILIYEKDRF